MSTSCLDTRSDNTENFKLIPCHEKHLLDHHELPRSRPQPGFKCLNSSTPTMPAGATSWQKPTVKQSVLEIGLNVLAKVLYANSDPLTNASVIAWECLHFRLLPRGPAAYHPVPSERGGDMAGSLFRLAQCRLRDFANI